MRSSSLRIALKFFVVGLFTSLLEAATNGPWVESFFVAMLLMYSHLVSSTTASPDDEGGMLTKCSF